MSILLVISTSEVNWNSWKCKYHGNETSR